MLNRLIYKNQNTEANIDTLYGWNKRAKDTRLDLGPGTQMPDTAMSLIEEVQKPRQQNREQAKETARLKEESEFLSEAGAFFRSEPWEVNKNLRMQFIDRKTEDVGKARMKEELLYGRYNTKQMTIKELENPDLGDTA